MVQHHPILLYNCINKCLFLLDSMLVCLVSSTKFVMNVGKIHYTPIVKGFIGTIDMGEGLQQVMLPENTTTIQLFQPRSINADEQHIVNHQQVNLPFLKSS